MVAVPPHLAHPAAPDAPSRPARSRTPPARAGRPATRRGPGGQIPLPTAPAEPLAGTTIRGIDVAHRVDPRCVALLGAHGGLLVARISGVTGAQACRQAVDALYEGADGMAWQGVDARRVLSRLGKAELRHRLQVKAIAAEPVNGIDGRPIEHRFLLIDDLAEFGLHIALVTGTGSKVDERLRSPATDWLAAQVLAVRPGLVFARDWRRWGRDPWAFAPLAHAFAVLQAQFGQPAFGGDNRSGITELDRQFEERLFHEGVKGREEVEQLQFYGALGSREKTGTTMTGGRVPYASHVSPAPGLATAVVRPGAFDPVDGAAGPPDPGGSQARYLYIDEPASRPDPALVVTSRAPLGRGGGQPPVDQAGLVRWFLTHYGTRDADGTLWDPTACADYLVEHGFATERLRSLHRRPDPSWAVGGQTRARRRAHARKICQSILRHLDEYRDGAFTVGLLGGGERVTIRNVVPAAGAWMSPADHARITDFRGARVPPRLPGQRFLAGQPVTLNGQPAKLLASHRGPQRYHFADPVTGRHLGTREQPVPPLPQPVLVAAIGQALLTADELPRLAPTEHDAAAELRQERSRLAAATDELATENATERRLLRSGKIHDELLATVDREFNERAARIKRNQAQLDALQAAIAAEEDKAPAGIRDRDLVSLLRALTDPRSAVARALLRGNLVLAVQTSRLQQPGRPVAVLHQLRGYLLLRDERASFRAPIHLDHVAPGRTDVNGQLRAAVDGLRDGHTLRETLGGDWKRWGPLIRLALGIPDEQFPLNHVDDPRLLRLGMAVRFPPLPPESPDPTLLAGPTLASAELGRLARRLHEPAALLRRIAAVHTRPGPRRRWLLNPSPVAAAAFRLARRSGRVRGEDLPARSGLINLLHGPYGTEWTVRGADAVLVPCRTCGGTSRVPLRLREATGSVCTRCRTDRAGVRWPRTYDRYAQST